MHANRLVLGVLFGASLPWLASGTDEPPSSGPVLDTGRHLYEEVNVIRVTPTHLFFRHSRGVASLPISQLPPEVRMQIDGRSPRTESPPPSSPSKPPAPAGAPEPSPAPKPAASPAPGTGTAPATRPSQPTGVVAPPLKQPPRTPAIRTRALWAVYPIRNPCPSPLGTGAIPGPRGLPVSWFHVHPSVYPQTLANPDWRRLAERDFFITSARNHPALLTRHIVSGW